MKNSYIVLEGLDGSGKTTQFNMLLEHFGNKAVGVREPGGTPMAEQLRTLVKDAQLLRASRTNLYLFSAARADVLDSVVRPAIAAGKTVISDRNWLSTMAYQAGGDGVGMDEIVAVSKLATQEFFEPDLTIFIDIDMKTRRKRISASQQHGAHDYFDTKQDDYFMRVREKYLQAITRFKQHVIIDGAQDKDEVAAAILQALKKYSEV